MGDFMMPINSFWIALVWVISIMVGCAESAPQGPDYKLLQTFDREAVHISFTITPAVPVFEEPCLLVVAVTAPAGDQVIFPELASKAGNFYQVSATAPQLVKAAGPRYVHERSYRLELLHQEKLVIPALEFRYGQKSPGPPDQAPSLNIFPTEEISCAIACRYRPSQKPTELQELRGNADFPASRLPWIVTLLCLGVAILLFGYWRWRKSHRQLPEPASQPPETIALEAIDRLLASDYLVRGEYKQFYFELTNIVRHYLENVYQIRAPQQTTEEFLAIFCGSGAFPAVTQELVRQFLEQADLVKYADVRPQSQEITELVTSARTIVSSPGRTALAEKKQETLAIAQV